MTREEFEKAQGGRASDEHWRHFQAVQLATVPRISEEALLQEWPRIADSAAVDALLENTNRIADIESRLGGVLRHVEALSARLGEARSERVALAGAMIHAGAGDKVLDILGPVKYVGLKCALGMELTPADRTAMIDMLD